MTSIAETLERSSDSDTDRASRAPARRRVAIIVSYLSHFRAPFYEALRGELSTRHIDLRLLYGETQGHWSRVLRWAEPFRVKVAPGGLTWFPVLSRIARTTDLVVSEDATRHLINYALLALRKVGGPKLVLWGHGWNHQTSDNDSLPERLKRYVGKRADAFFAYTPGIRAELIARGYDSSKTHDVRNTIPTPDVGPGRDDIERLRDSLGIRPGARVALYCGQMYPMKRLELLTRAAPLVKAAVPDFELILAGAGPSQSVAEEAARKHAYVHYVGPVFDGDKACCFSLAHACVIPGVVGLAVVDAFHHRVPPIVTRMDFHGPEVEYLNHGANGLLAEHSVVDLAAAIERLLKDGELRLRLVEGCRAASAELSMGNMVDRFVSGIVATLGDEKADGRRKQH